MCLDPVEDDLNILGNIAEDAGVLLVFTDLGVLACLLVVVQMRG